MTTPRWFSWLLVLGLFGFFGSSTSPASSPQTTGSFSSRVVATGLDWPWEVTWGPDGYLWVTERVGKRVTRINPRNGERPVALEVDEAYQVVGQDGVLGMALHPHLLHGVGRDFVYVAWTYAAMSQPEIEVRGRISRYTYDPVSETLRNPVVVLEGLPAHNDHLAGRLAFGPDGKLYFSVGDQGSNWLNNKCNANLAQALPTAAEIAEQDWTHYQGKILRIEPDGRVPADNPVLEGVRSHVFSYGHRNPQGLVFSPSGTLYAAEHGPSTDDEVNRIEAGMNYGWPRVAGHKDDQAYVYANWSLATGPTACDEMPFSSQAPPSVPTFAESDWSHADFTPPIQTFFTVESDFTGIATIAASGLDIYAFRNGIPGWSDSLLVAGMTRGAFYRMKLSADGREVEGMVEEVFRSTNRPRDMAIGPDGRTFYIVTDNEGRTLDGSGAPTRMLENPGALLEVIWNPGD